MAVVEARQCSYMWCRNMTKSPIGYCHIHENRGMKDMKQGWATPPSSVSRVPALSNSSNLAESAELAFASINPDLSDTDEDGFPKDPLRGRAYRSSALYMESDTGSKFYPIDFELLQVTEYEAQRLGGIMTPREYSIWRALGISTYDAVKWKRSGILSPYHASILQNEIGFPSGTINPAYDSDITIQINKMDDVESLEYLDFVADVHSQTDLPFRTIHNWYEDNWSSESAIKHIKAGHDIPTANDMHLEDQLAEALGSKDEAAYVFLNQSTPRMLESTRNLRDGVRAMRELRESGLSIEDTLRWVESDFAALGTMKQYRGNGASLEEAQRAESRILLNKMAEEEEDWTRLPVSIQGKMMDIIQDSNSFKVSLKFRRDKEYHVHVGSRVQESIRTAYLMNESPQLPLQGSDREQFILDWVRYRAHVMDYTKEHTREQSRVAQQHYALEMGMRGFTPQDAELIAKDSKVLNRPKLDELMDAVRNGTPLEWALAWGADS